MKTILIKFDNSFFVRNFLRTDVFAILNKTQGIKIKTDTTQKITGLVTIQKTLGIFMAPHLFFAVPVFRISGAIPTSQETYSPLVSSPSSSIPGRPSGSEIAAARRFSAATLPLLLCARQPLAKGPP